MYLKPLDEKQTCKTFFNSDFPKWANLINPNEKMVCSPGMSQRTLKLNAFMCWWLCFTALGEFLFFFFFYLCLIPSIISPPQSPAQGHRVQRAFFVFFSHVARCRPGTTLLHVRLSLFSPLLPARLHWGLFRIFFFIFFFSIFKQTQHKLYINKQITNFMFPVLCQVCSGAPPSVKLSALSPPLSEPSRAQPSRLVRHLSRFPRRPPNTRRRRRKKKSKATTVVSTPSKWTWCRLRQEIKVRKGGKASPTVTCASVREAAAAELKAPV